MRPGDRLLKAIKDQLRKKDEKIDYSKLRRGGYSKAMIARRQLMERAGKP